MTGVPQGDSLIIMSCHGGFSGVPLGFNQYFKEITFLEFPKQ